MALPISRVCRVDAIEARAAAAVSLPLLQPPCQKPGALHGHADAFSDSGMGLAGRIAHAKQPATFTSTNTGSNRPGGQPRSLPRRTSQRLPHARARFHDVRQDRLARVAALASL